MSAKPYKITVAKWREYLRCISEDGLGRAAAAEAIGVCRATVKAYIESDPKRIEERDEAEMRRDDKVVNALFQAACSRNVTACLAWLFNRRPEEWADKRNLRVTGKDGGPIEYSSLDAIDREIARLEEALAAHDEPTSK